MPRTSLMMRLDIVASVSYGRRVQSAVIASIESTERLALRLRIFESLERIVEPLRRTDDGEVETEVASEHRLDLLGFAPAEPSVVNEDAMESRADNLLQELADIAFPGDRRCNLLQNGHFR